MLWRSCSSSVSSRAQGVEQGRASGRRLRRGVHEVAHPGACLLTQDGAHTYILFDFFYVAPSVCG